MSEEHKKKICREWGQWKRRWLSKKERRNLTSDLFVEFMVVKNHQELLR